MKGGGGRGKGGVRGEGGWCMEVIETDSHYVLGGERVSVDMHTIM